MNETPFSKTDEAILILERMGWVWTDKEWFHPNLTAQYPEGLTIPDDPRAKHLYNVLTIAREDATGLIKGDPKYGYSWKARGGVGAFMMAARKFDRLNHSLSPPSETLSKHANLGEWLKRYVPAWDVFAALRADTRSEGVIDDIRDLRRYLLLIEAEARAQGIVHGAHRDNQQE